MAEPAKAKRRPHAWGTLECAICHRTVDRHCSTQKLCGDPACKRARDRDNWNRKKAIYRARASRSSLLASRLPTCPTCGGNLDGETRNGVTWEYCLRCSYEAQVLVRGLANKFRTASPIAERLEAYIKKATSPAVSTRKPWKQQHPFNQKKYGLKRAS